MLSQLIICRYNLFFPKYTRVQNTRNFTSLLNVTNSIPSCLCHITDMKDRFYGYFCFFLACYLISEAELVFIPILILLLIP